MSFFRDSLVLQAGGEFRTMLGNADYLQLPKVNALTKYNGKSLIREGRIIDHEGLINLWKTMFLKYGIANLSRLDLPLTLILPPSYTNSDIEFLTYHLFQTINVPGLYILEEALAVVYGSGLQSGVVINIGEGGSSFSVVLDNTPIQASKRLLPVGGSHITQYLLSLLPANHPLQKKESDLLFMKEVKRQVCLATRLGEDEDESGSFDFSIEGHRYTVPKSIRRQSIEVLFNPSLLTGSEECQGIHETLYSSITCALDPAKRGSGGWEALLLTGGSSQIHGLESRIEKEVSLLLACSDTSNDSQPREVKFLKVIPDYMSTYRGRGGDCAYLGGTIVGKLVFGGGSGGVGYISKQDYNLYGPGVALMK